MSRGETVMLQSVIMVKIAKNVLITLAIMACSVNASAGTKKARSFDWTPVINAIIQVESQGNPKAVSGKSCGIMQITPICVKECNRILQMRQSKKRYTMSDRFDVRKSKEMFLLIQSFYNKANNVEYAIRAWNGGHHYSRQATQNYYEKVLRQMN